jgi:hypothetical protein
VPNHWAFAPSFDPIRGGRLAAFDTFAKVAAAVIASSKIVGAKLCEASSLGAKDCWRPTVSVAVSPEAFDAFFNSPGGYRAQYLVGPEEGQAANGALIRALEPRLSEAVVEHCGSTKLSAEWIQNAFVANSAKIWPNEADLDFLDVTHDLAVDSWRNNRDLVNAPAGAGLWAPEGTQLTVFGAFMDPWGNEIVARNKIGRRFEIHACGFT